MKMFVVSVFAALVLAFAASPRSEAAPSGGGGPGGGSEGIVDCFFCWYIGGWGPMPGPMRANCSRSEGGNGGGCYVANNKCHYTGGCQSLPDDVGFGLIL